jgi:hypothetical protein
VPPKRAELYPPDRFAAANLIARGSSMPTNEAPGLLPSFMADTASMRRYLT